MEARIFIQPHTKHRKDGALTPAEGDGKEIAPSVWEGGREKWQQSKATKGTETEVPKGQLSVGAGPGGPLGPDGLDSRLRVRLHLEIQAELFKVEFRGPFHTDPLQPQAPQEILWQ